MANNKEEALNIVRKMIADGFIEQDVAEKYFPELKESEDEKIRKLLIRKITQEMGSLSHDEASKCIAYLEKQGKQKPAWSEEDEKMFESTIKHLKESTYSAFRPYLKKDVDWLKSLKDRVGCEVNCATTKEWSEEDGNMLDEFIKYCEYSIAYNGIDSAYAKTWEKRKSWLKSLRPQSKSIIKL